MQVYLQVDLCREDLGVAWNQHDIVESEGFRST